MIQFYTMPLTPDERDTLLQAVFWINASAGPLSVTVPVQKSLQDGAESIELERGDWVEMQKDIEQWGRQCPSRRRDALRLAILIESTLCGDPSRTIDEPVKVAAPVERQPSLFGGE